MKKVQRQSTVVRNNLVFSIYEELKKEHGEAFNFIIREFIYEKIKERTGLHTKTIAKILNHSDNSANCSE